MVVDPRMMVGVEDSLLWKMVVGFSKILQDRCGEVHKHAHIQKQSKTQKPCFTAFLAGENKKHVSSPLWRGEN